MEKEEFVCPDIYMMEDCRIFGDRWPVVFPTPSEEKCLQPITTYLMSLLKGAELLFGDRDKEFTFFGVEFLYEGGPRLWWHNHCAKIQLQFSAFLNLDIAIRQCAHECVHLITPIERKEATFLEEGAATFFERYVQKQDKWQPIEGKYAEAYTRVKELLEIDEQAIKKVRRIGQPISKITKQQLLAAYPALAERTADILVQKFYDDADSTFNNSPKFIG
jgi:hypothetical protein